MSTTLTVRLFEEQTEDSLREEIEGLGYDFVTLVHLPGNRCVIDCTDEPSARKLAQVLEGVGYAVTQE